MPYGSAMAPEPPDGDVFETSGRVHVHLTSIDWRNPNDQRVVVASLVQAAYVSEKDRHEKRDDTEALAPVWWKHFGFERIKILIDRVDRSIFGCMYEFKPLGIRDPSAPRFVVAIRGTMKDQRHLCRDGLLDVSVAIGGIDRTSRVRISIECIRDLIRSSGCDPRDVWIGGHSLGASIALVTGKCTAKMDNWYFKTFLFNPPFPSFLKLFPNLDKELKESLRTWKENYIKMPLLKFFKKHIYETHEEFSELALWTPYLFVGPDDPISAAYISYFERRETVEGGQLKTRISLMEMLTDGIAGGLERPNRLPSACIVENQKRYNSWLQSHGIAQWWEEDINLKFSYYYY